MTHEGEHLKGPLVYFVATVGDYTDNDLLPSFRSPHLRTIATTQMCDILDDASHPDETDESGTRKMGHSQTHAFMVRVNSTSSSLYMVMTTKSSVWRPYRYGLRKYFERMKSSGSHVAAVYRILFISSEVFPFGTICDGTWTSKTRFPS